MVERQITCFDLRQIARSGQCFRMYETAPGEFGVTAMGRYLKIRQRPADVGCSGGRMLESPGLATHIVTFDCTEQEFNQIWAHYFDLATDYAGFISRIGKRDKYLRQAAAWGSGIRILNQDLWEVMVTFLISQNNHIKRIQGCVERLCAALGERRTGSDGTVFYTMPGPEAVAASPQKLTQLRLGYRDKYIARLASGVLDGTVDLERLKGLKQPKKAHEELTHIYGVGDKVADCIQLFGLHHIDAFPVDTWVKKILAAHYPKGFPLRRYRGCAGVMQQYMFYYEISHSHRANAES